MLLEKIFANKLNIDYKKKEIFNTNMLHKYCVYNINIYKY